MPELHRKATWNPVRDLWETDQTVLLSEHSAAYSETLPPSGMTRNGVLFERPKSEHPTSGPVSSCLPTENALLRTPCAAEAEGGPLHPDTARARGQTLRLTGQILAMTGDLLPTPRATEGSNGGPNQRGSSGDLTLSSATVRMLPTPRTSDTNGPGTHGTGGLDLRTAVTMPPTPRATRGGSATETVDLLPTPTAGNFNDGEDVAAWDARRVKVKEATGNGNGMGEPLGIAAKRMAETLFGVYAPAIRRWEQVTGHPAPPPTEPTGRGGAHRLSARFAEWMMGLIPGWVTDIPISRTEQLRAIGNGVVPQQAVAALQDMRAAFETETGTVAASLN